MLLPKIVGLNTGYFLADFVDLNWVSPFTLSFLLMITLDAREKKIKFKGLYTFVKWKMLRHFPSAESDRCRKWWAYLCLSTQKHGSSGNPVDSEIRYRSVYKCTNTFDAALFTGLVTKSSFFSFYAKNQWPLTGKDIVIFCSFQQKLPCLGLGPLKGSFELTRCPWRALNLVLCFQSFRYTRTVSSGVSR